MRLFGRKSRSARETEFLIEISSLTDRVCQLERDVGKPSRPRLSFCVGFGSHIYPEPSVKDCIAAITDHLGIEVVSNPESHAKWVARKVGVKK